MNLGQRKRIIAPFLFILFILLPGLSLAKEIQAGFPPQSIWVSKTTAVAGERIEIFTAVYNGNSAKLEGTVTFTVDDTRVGTRDFELAAGASGIVSIEWKAGAGEHKIAAAIENASATLSQQETAAVTVTVLEPPPPPPLANAATVASEIIAETARAATPIIASSLNSAYQFTESLRLDAISRLEGVVASDSPALTQGELTTTSATSSVAGTSTSFASGFSTEEQAAPSAISQITQAAAAAALVALKSRALFYPLFLLTLLGLLYGLTRWALRRP